MRRNATLLVLLSIASLASCSTTKGAVLPPRSSPPPAIPESSSPSPSRPHDAALASYTAYWPASDLAATAPPDKARELLEPYTAKSYRDAELKGIKQLQKARREPWGTAQVRVYEVAINGKRARIRDCQDVSGRGLAHADTHEVIPESTQGPATRHVEARLDQDRAGIWRLIRITALDTPCTPPSSS